MSDSRDPLVGQVIGRYRLLERVGAGGMAYVYRAAHVFLDRVAAVKVLRRDLAKDPVQRSRFLREARAVNRIDHPNIVSVLDFGETDDGLLFLVMEFVAGEPMLRVMATEGPFDTARALDYVTQIGQALVRAHGMGVIHRDLKPENLLLVRLRNQPELVKVLDFGIAKVADQPALSGSQQIFGTPGYIAPEYLASSEIDGRADLYSVGVILYEMVTGALPFDYEYPGDLLVKHLTEEPILPSERRPGTPIVIEDFLLRCLAKKPVDRFRDAHHFLAEVERLRQALGGPAPVRRATLAPRPAMRSPAGSSVPTRTQLGPRTRSSRLGIAGIEAWRARLQALKLPLEAAPRPYPPLVDQALAAVAPLEAEFADVAERIVLAHEELDSASLTARDVRAVLADGLDLATASRSALEPALEALETEQAAVWGAYRASVRFAEGDAFLWTVASIRQELRELEAAHRVKCRAADQLASELDASDARHEAATEAAGREIAGLSRQLDGVCDALEDPVSLLERFVEAGDRHRRRD